MNVKINFFAKCVPKSKHKIYSILKVEQKFEKIEMGRNAKTGFGIDMIYVIFICKMFNPISHFDMYISFVQA